jgi:hypothetical protein
MYRCSHGLKRKLRWTPTSGAVSLGGASSVWAELVWPKAPTGRLGRCCIAGSRRPPRGIYSGRRIRSDEAPLLPAGVRCVPWLLQRTEPLRSPFLSYILQALGPHAQLAPQELALSKTQQRSSYGSPYPKSMRFGTSGQYPEVRLPRPLFFSTVRFHTALGSPFRSGQWAGRAWPNIPSPGNCTRRFRTSREPVFVNPSPGRDRPARSH